MMKPPQNWGLLMKKPDPRWEVRKFASKEKSKSKPKKTYDPVNELCRVVPFRLAQIPDIGHWLMQQRKTRATINLNSELTVVYRELAELRKMHLLED